jgi:putative NIF3 family GTP cyclohydrolase 1 type 2
MYKIKDIIVVLEEMAPLAYAEDFDNVGLLVIGRKQQQQGNLFATMLENVIDEAIAQNCNPGGFVFIHSFFWLKENNR